MNVRDSEVVGGLLRRAGYSLVYLPEEADAVIINTCSVRQHAEDKVWSEIGRLTKRAAHNVRRKGQSSSGVVPIIGVIGCMAQNYKEKIFERAPCVNFVVGPTDIHKIPGIIDAIISRRRKDGQEEGFFEVKTWETEGATRPQEIYHTGFYEDKEHAYVVISEGCSNACSYCVVPYVRGALHHRNDKDIIKEVKEAIAEGITRVTLLGQNVNAYHYGDTGFTALLERVAQLVGLKELSFITSHPKDASAELFTVMHGLPKLKKYLHLPVQSGSDRILKLMNRGYARKKYIELAGAYRKAVLGGVLTTDIIVGFPTETEDDFMDTYNLVEDIQFDAAFIFKYSPRPHTEAAKMVDDVPKEEKERRHSMILELQKKISVRKR